MTTRLLQRPGGRSGILPGVVWRLGLLAGVAAVVMVLTAVAAASPAIASTSAVPHRQPQPGVDAVPGRGLTLARAPAGLRAAVARTPGLRAAAAVGAWSQQAGLADPGATAGDFFGGSVAISGTTAVVGAEGSNSGTGAAYVFVRSGTTWSQQTELTASDGAAGDEFGASVAISGTTVVVGAFGKNSKAGAAYVFVRSGTTWSPAGRADHDRRRLRRAGPPYGALGPLIWWRCRASWCSTLARGARR